MINVNCTDLIIKYCLHVWNYYTVLQKCINYYMSINGFEKIKENRRRQTGTISLNG